MKAKMQSPHESSKQSIWWRKCCRGIWGCAKRSRNNQNW